jgi:hypothetical protein
MDVDFIRIGQPHPLRPKRGARLVNQALIYRSGGDVRRLRLKSDVSECLLILREVLPKDVPKSLRLLRAQVDALRIFDADRFGRFVAQRSEGQVKIPHADPYLHTIGIGFAVIGSVGQSNFGRICR